MKKTLLATFILCFSIGAMACSGDKKEHDKGKPKTDGRIERSI
jgi:hypothetical protein